MSRARPILPSDALRKTILSCGMTRYEIAQRSGVSESILSRLINGHGGITVSTLDKLAPVLGLRLETAQ